MNQNSYIFIQENAFENIVWKMAAMLSRPQCVNARRPCPQWVGKSDTIVGHWAIDIWKSSGLQRRRIEDMGAIPHKTKGLNYLSMSLSQIRCIEKRHPLLFMDKRQKQSMLVPDH